MIWKNKLNVLIAPFVFVKDVGLFIMVLKLFYGEHNIWFQDIYISS